MDKMDNHECALEWLTYAERDLSSADFLTNQRPVPIEIICFHCQQSAEKSLKGLLVTEGIRPPKIHDLRELYNLCAPVMANIAVILAQCNALNKFSVGPRYPSQIELTEQDMKEALANAQAILQFAKPVIQGERC
jgi:HEPN domain-containing protein